MGRLDCSTFLKSFVLPLVRGGPLTVGPPIDADEIITLIQGLPHASAVLVDIDEARQQAISTLAVRSPSLVFDSDELYLSVALHNLLFLAHPRRSSITVTEGAMRRVLEATIAFASQPCSEDQTRVLARHGLFHNLFAMFRTDTTLTWWTGSAKYCGQSPPTRLTTWTRVRRVQRETAVVHFRDLVSKFDMLPVLATLLRRSPLTLLLAHRQDSLPFRWEDVAFVLHDGALTRSLSYLAIAGDDVTKSFAACKRYAVALDHMLARAPARATLRLVCSFLVHLNVLMTMAYELDEIREVCRETLEDEDRRTGLVEFLSLPMVLRGCAAALAEPPDLVQDTTLAHRFAAQQEMLAAVLPAEAVTDWKQRIEQQIVV